MRVVVTGGDGFAGRWLCRQLVAEGSWVSAWVRKLPADPIPGVAYRVQDIRDASGCAKSMREDSPHQVFHLAAITHLGQANEEPIAAFDTNARGTVNVMQAVPKMAVAVYASTCHVYGPPQALPITESHPCSPAGTYAKTKYEGELAALKYCSKAVIARSFHHTGPEQSTRYALADWARQVAKGQTVQVGDLSLKRDYCDVRDICLGYRVLANRGVPQEIYNLCTGVAPTLGTLLQGMGQGHPVKHATDAHRIRSGDIPEFRGDPSKAEGIGWRRSISQEQMLKDLVLAATALN